MSKNNLYDLLIVGLLGIAISCFPFARYINNAILVICLQIVCQILIIVFRHIYIKKYSKLDYSRQKIDLKNTLILVPTLLVCGSNFLFAFISNNLGEFSFGVYQILEIVLAAFVALNEEIIFRLLLINNLEIKKDIYKILISAGAFGVAHLTLFFSSFDPGTLLVPVYTFFLGLLLAFSFMFTKSFIPGVIIHFLFNSINNTLFNSFSLTTFDIWNYILINGAVVLVIGLYVFLLFYFFEKKKKTTEEIIEEAS